MIKTIIFDLNKVVVRLGGVSEGEYQKVLGIEKKVFFDRLTSLRSGYGVGKVSLEERFLLLLKRLGLKKELVKKAVELYNKDFLVMEGIEEVLGKLKKGYRLIMLAGDGHGAIKTKVEDLGLRGYFSEIYITCEEGLGKDEPEIYLRVLKKARLKPEETLFVDDLESHIRVAQSLGIQTILFKCTGQLKKELVKFGINI